VTTPVTHRTEPSDTGSPGVSEVTSTSSVATRVLGAVALVGVAAVAWLALVATGPDRELGDTVRLLFIHVPMPIVAYLACFLCAAGSLLFLWKGSRWWDLVAESAAEIGAVFAALTIVSGAIWGKPTWGTWWVWDARLTTTLLLLLLLVGYLALRRTSFDPDAAARRAAVVGLLLVPNVIVVNRSVEWWRTVHQPATLARPDPQIAGLQLFTLVVAIVVGLAVFSWLLVHRFRLGWLERQAAVGGLTDAVAERRAEADDDGLLDGERAGDRTDGRVIPGRSSHGGAS
jgi:heme exporter protein C